MQQDARSIAISSTMSRGSSTRDTYPWKDLWVTTDYVVYTSDADTQGVGGCGIAVHRSLVPNVEEVRALSSRLVVLKMTTARRHHPQRTARPLWIISAHAPTEAADEKDKDMFFDSLHRELSRIPVHDRILIGSDTNAHFGRDVAEESPIGKWFYQEEETSDNGHRWLSLLDDHGLVLASTLRRPPSRSSLFTWTGSVPLSVKEQEKRGMRTLRAQLDYIMMRSSDHGMIRKCRSVPRADFDSDHSPVVITLNSYWKPRPPPRRPPPHDFSLLSHNEDIRRSFQKTVATHMGIRTRKGLTDAESWTEAVNHGISKDLPKKKPPSKYSEVSDRSRRLYHLLGVIKRRRHPSEEKRTRRMLRESLKEDRNDLWMARSDQFEQAWNEGNSKHAYTLLKLFSGRLHRAPSIISNGQGSSAVGEAALDIWRDYFKDLLNQPPPRVPPLSHVQRATYDISTNPPTLEEVVAVVRNMKNGRAAGDDGIPAEALKALPPSGIRSLHSIIVDIWTTGLIPDTWRPAIIVPLHKKGSTTSVSNYRGISLLRTAYKCLERLIVSRILPAREQTTREEQCGFRPGRGTIDQIHTLRRIIEVHYEHGRPLQLAFLDYASAFDSPDRDRLFDALAADGVPSHLLDLLRDLNSRTDAVVRTPAGNTAAFNVATGVRQGSVCGPILFNYCIDDIFRRVADEFPPEVVLYPSDRGLIDLEYADDAVILTTSETTLQAVCSRIEELSAAYGLRLRPEKCKVLPVQCSLAHGPRIGGEEI